MPPSPSLTLWPAMRATGSGLAVQRGVFRRVDPALHGMDVGDGGEVQAAPPDEGADGFQEALPQVKVAGDQGGP